MYTDILNFWASNDEKDGFWFRYIIRIYHNISQAFKEEIKELERYEYHAYQNHRESMYQSSVSFSKNMYVLLWDAHEIYIIFPEGLAQERAEICNNKICAGCNLVYIF